MRRETPYMRAKKVPLEKVASSAAPTLPGTALDARRYPTRSPCNQSASSGAALEVKRSICYHAVQPSPTQVSELAMSDRIKAALKFERCRYSYRRVWSEDYDEGLPCALAYVRHMKRERGMKSIQPNSLRPAD